MERGHDLNSILHFYTIDQINLFNKVYAHLETERILALSFAMRIAINGDEKAWKKFVKTIINAHSKDKKLATKEDYYLLKELLHGRRNRNR